MTTKMKNKIHIYVILFLALIACGKETLTRNEDVAKGSIPADNISDVTENDSSLPNHGTETGNGMTLSLSFSGFTSSENVSLDSTQQQSQGLRNNQHHDEPILTKTATFTIQTALLVVEKIGFIPAENCQTHNFQDMAKQRVDLTGPFIINLLTQTSSPAFDTITLPQGEYCGVGMMFRKFDPLKMKHHLPKNHPVLNHSMYIAGMINDSLPFILSADFNRPFLLLNEQENLSVETLSNALLEIGFDIGKWFDGITTTQIKQKPVQGTVTAIINARNNILLFRQIIKNIYESTSLFADKNHNGKLDPNERHHQMGLAHGHYDDEINIEEDDNSSP